MGTTDTELGLYEGEVSPVGKRLPEGLVGFVYSWHSCDEGMLGKDGYKRSLMKPDEGLSNERRSGSGEGEQDMEGTSPKSRTHSTVSI